MLQHLHLHLHRESTRPWLALVTVLLLTTVLIDERSFALRLSDEESWNCTVAFEKELAVGATWTQMNCSSQHFFVFEELPIGPLVFNVIDVDLFADNLLVTPAQANQSTTYKLQTIPEMAQQNPDFIAGMNGGYFWELDNSGFKDDVCFGKTREDAEQPVSESNPNYGVGDTLLVVNGQVLSRNCDCIYGYNRPTALIINGTNSTIVKLPKAGGVSSDVQNAIGAGPNLVSYDFDKKESYIDIPIDDENVNIFGHGANTAVALVLEKGGLATHLYMITINGHDGGTSFDPTSGINSHELAHFLKYKLEVSMAMEMDQGGSTTMWIKGEPNDGVVSSANNLSPDPGVRSIFDGLFLQTVG